MDPREARTAAALADLGGFQTYRKVALTRARRMEKPFYVETPHGPTDGKAGDYLCLDSKGHPYPCDAEVFHASYTLHDLEGEGG